MQFKEISCKLIVSKRLSQCLHPALSTGAHQRSLDWMFNLIYQPSNGSIVKA
ncbi:hypothetical protein EV361DRAFT_940781 [Lentinula raphanica]|nr:hypothetical protein EV361DRAFT_940781 [Lentinula raphanica]